MSLLDYALMILWIGLVVWAWNLNVYPQGRNSQAVREALAKYGKASVRHEKKKDKRSG